MSQSAKGNTGKPVELGLVTDFPGRDARRTQYGSIYADSDKTNLPFECSQAPKGTQNGDVVCFVRSRGSEGGDTEFATITCRVTDYTTGSEHIELLASSSMPIVLQRVAAHYLGILDTPQQVVWLKKHADSLNILPPEAWLALKADVLQHPEIWQIAPPEARRLALSRSANYLRPLDIPRQVAWLEAHADSLNDLPEEAWWAVNAQALLRPTIWTHAPLEAREVVLRDARERLHKDFLAAEKAFCESPDQFPPPVEINCLKVAFVKDWAKRELNLALDDDQAGAVAAVTGDVQVVARAGSGKTRALVTRAIFLQKHCGVLPRQLLLLAFNKKAAEEMRQRLQKVLEDEIPHVMTFHALAYALVHPDEEPVYDDTSADQLGVSREVQEVIDEHIRSASHGRVIQELMLAHFREDWERIEEGRFTLPMGEFLAHRRSLPRETLSGEYVKSFGERLIANTLFEHGIDYRYESNFRWSGTNYRPDFMIGNRQEGGVVIEYFGLTGDSDYDDMSDAKRQFWAKQEKWRFLEYSPADITTDGVQAFVSRLLDDLQGAGLRPRRLDEEEIWASVRDRAIDSFTKAMSQFVARCRKLNLSDDELANRKSSHVACSEAERLFLDVGHSVYSGYVRRLADGGKEDFDGLMWRAVDQVSSGSTRFARDRRREQGDLRNLRFVMVDEFQDFSEMFSRLLGAIRLQNPAVDFFCVGDDWQAINSFAGSDPRHFETFEERFRNPSRVHISTNWRSERAIVEAGNALMRDLGEPAKARQTAGAGECVVGWLDEFEPTAPEEERHEGDEFTPAVLRLVSGFLKRGMDVVMLSRRNGLPWYVNYTERRRSDGLERFQEHIRAFLPEDDRRRVTASTTHKYKGLEKPAVVVLDALDRSYPLVHPHWVFLRLFGDSVDRIVAEERRLFYVALTRAEKSIVLLTESKRPSQFLDDIKARSTQRVDWRQFQPVGAAGCELVEVRVHNAYDVRDQLKQQGYSWAGQRNANSKYWRRSLQRDGFDFERDIINQPWAHGNVRIEVYTDANKLLHSWPER
ncbi:MAG: ATP-dependent DNA helicase PcrA [Armatimonadetes bacterium OLB18]|nr:MAG: ATP-dependent DNA helicase PcrA [Armatimonadetes bacterium OLB18]